MAGSWAIAFGVLAGPAFAQDVLLEDFDGGGSLAWTDVTPIHSSGAPTGYFYESPPEWFGFPAGDGQAGICEAQHGFGGYCEALSSPFVVTHDTLSVAFVTDYDASVFVERTDSWYLGSAWSDALNVWETDAVALGDACGHEIVLGWRGSAESWGFSALDDVRFTGAVCPAYVDGDGDGLCPQGTDLDSDGTCIGAGEPVLGAIVDCDDLVAGTSCLSLVQEAPAPGERMRLQASGAVPGERVGFAFGELGGTLCPPRLGGLCLDLGLPLANRWAIADGAGVATVRMMIPAGTAAHTLVYAQAAVVRGAGGATSVKSNLTIDEVYFP